MCYYNGQKVTHAEFIRLKQLEKAVSKYDFLNRDIQVGFDYSLSAVLKRIPDQEDFDIVQMEWGYIPDANRWPFVETREDLVKMRTGYVDPRGKYQQPMTTLNAVSEELLYKNKIYREAALQRRCLVLSNGFYEWRHIHRLNKRTGQPLKTADKYPYFISLKDKEYYYMAGIWQPWTDAVTGEYVESLAIVTTTAIGHELMSQVHNSKLRMPTILNEDLAYRWMFEDLTENQITEIAITQFPSNEMQAYTIAKNFRESINPTEPFEYADLPPLVFT